VATGLTFTRGILRANVRLHVRMHVDMVDVRSRSVTFACEV